MAEKQHFVGFFLARLILLCCKDPLRKKTTLYEVPYNFMTLHYRRVNTPHWQVVHSGVRVYSEEE